MITTGFDEDRELGKLITEHRKRHKMSQRTLATHMGYSAAYVNDLEHGRRALQLRAAKVLTALFDHDFIMELLVRVIPDGYIVTKERQP